METRDLLQQLVDGPVFTTVKIKVLRLMRPHVSSLCVRLSTALKQKMT